MVTVLVCAHICLWVSQLCEVQAVAITFTPGETLLNQAIVSIAARPIRTTALLKDFYMNFATSVVIISTAAPTFSELYCQLII